MACHASPPRTSFKPHITSTHISTNLAPILYSHATNLTLLVHRSHGLHAVTSSCSPHLPWLRCALSYVHAEGPSSFTYVGHLNELQPTITNSQHNCRPPTSLPCYSSTTMQFLTPILRILHGSGETERSLYRLSLLYYLRAGTLTVWTVSIWGNPR